MCKAPVLVPPRFGEPFLLYTDASLYAVGCCLAQEDESGDKHPIAYGSHKLTPTQCNWSTIEREAFAVLWEYRIGERTETSVTSPSFHYVITGVGR